MNTRPFLCFPARPMLTGLSVLCSFFLPLSSKAEDWQKVPIPPAGFLETSFPQSIAYGNGLFIAGGEGKIHQSVDGSTWTESVFPVNFNVAVREIAFGSGRYVALAERDLFSSADGVQWSKSLDLAASSPSSLRRHGNVFITTGVFSTFDPIPGELVQRSGFFNEYFYGGLSSPDGLAWEWFALPAPDYVPAAFSLESSDRPIPTLTSTIGTRSYGLIAGNSNGELTFAETGQERLGDHVVLTAGDEDEKVQMATDGAQRVITSDGGSIVWGDLDSGLGGRVIFEQAVIYDVFYSPTAAAFFATGVQTGNGTRTNTIWRSPTGTSWAIEFSEITQAGEPRDGIRAITEGGGKLVAVGWEAAYVLNLSNIETKLVTTVNEFSLDRSSDTLTVNYRVNTTERTTAPVSIELIDAQTGLAVDTTGWAINGAVGAATPLNSVWEKIRNPYTPWEFCHRVGRIPREWQRRFNKSQGNGGMIRQKNT